MRPKLHIDGHVRISDNELEIMSDIFEASIKAESSFNEKFKPSYDGLKKIFEKMKCDLGFQGEAKEGFMEIFDILLQLHLELNDNMPELFEQFKSFEENLEALKTRVVYTALED